MTDKKIEEYLERAWKVAGLDIKQNWSELTRNRIVEIAKMIQLEEHREQIEITSDQEIDGIKLTKYFQDQALEAKKNL